MIYQASRHWGKRCETILLHSRYSNHSDSIAFECSTPMSQRRSVCVRPYGSIVRSPTNRKRGKGGNIRRQEGGSTERRSVWPSEGDATEPIGENFGGARGHHTDCRFNIGGRFSGEVRSNDRRYVTNQQLAQIMKRIRARVWGVSVPFLVVFPRVGC